MCSTDFSVEREEIYSDEEDELSQGEQDYTDRGEDSEAELPPNDQIGNHCIYESTHIMAFAFLDSGHPKAE